MIASLANIHEFQICEFLSTEEMLRMSEVSTTYLSYRNYLREIKIYYGKKKKLRALRRLFSKRGRFLFLETLTFKNKCTSSIIRNTINVMNYRQFNKWIYVEFPKEGLDDESISVLNLKKNTCIDIEAIDISHNEKITDKGFEHLIYIISNCPISTLMLFSFAYTNITSQGFNYFLRSSEMNKGLFECIGTIDFSGCHIGDENLVRFIRLIKDDHFPSLMSLRLSSTNCKDYGISELGSAFLEKKLIY